MKTLLIAMLFSLLVASTLQAAERPPNIVFIFVDDQGYYDLGCYGATEIKTPRIDAMANAGTRFTDYYAAAPICSPSRAGLLTGCYPRRVGNATWVHRADSPSGIHPDELTIAELFKANGYATACIGKWHLGDQDPYRPDQRGFDRYFGIPYSNDMNHPDNKGKPKVSSDDLWRDQESAVTLWNTPLIKNEKIVELPVDQRTVTRRYTDHAIDFIKKNKEKPFFVYLPHSMPHIPLYVPGDVYDPDPQNAYTCVIEHIDAEVGRVMNTIRELELSENTYVIYTSDNGPWLQFKNHGGSAGPLREGKGTTFEGGQRVPCVMWGPGRVPAGTECGELLGTIDMLPTIAALTSTPLPNDRKIDGLDVSALIHGESETSPRDEFVHYTSQGQLEGLRQGKWKLLVKKPRRRRGQANANGRAQGQAPQIMLFDLSKDVGEQNNVREANPEIVEKLRARMTELDAEITANARAPWTTDQVSPIDF